MSRSLAYATSALLLCLEARAAIGQTPALPADASRPWEIIDNSFLVEEAFNQEPGVVQNIFGWTRGENGGWAAAFTQEWPVFAKRHQISYTLPFSSAPGSRGLNDVLINYRFQLQNESKNRPAVSPRVSVILPTGRKAAGLGSGVTGWQINVPVSKQFGDLYVHANAGWTWLPRVDPDPTQGSETVSLTSPQLAGSGIWRVSPMFNVLLETVLLFAETTEEGTARRARILTVSPGFRRGWNIGQQQLVVGAAIPLTQAEGSHTAAAFAYLSYELPFR